MATTQTRTKSIQLDWKSDGQITVTPENEDRFMLQMKTAVEVLQQSKQAEKFELQFKVLLNMLGEWIKLHKNDVSKAYVTIKDTSLAFVVVRESSRYNSVFEDALTDLEFDIANDADLSNVYVEVIGLPSISTSALNSFLHSNFAFEYATSR
jgi:hypothetical protein